MRLLAFPAVFAVLVSGCTDFEAQDVEPGNRIGIISIDVAAPEVTTGTVLLQVNTTLDNLRAESGELVLTVKAFDSATNMLVETATADVGVLEKSKSRMVSIEVRVPRAASYRIEVLVEQDERIVQQGSVSASNLAALEPTVYDTGLRITQIDTQILSNSTSRVEMRMPVSITNEGTSASRVLRLQVKAREVSTSILADDEWIDIPSIGLDQTVVHDVRMEFPYGYNYALEALLWDGNVIVETGYGKVQFLPTYAEDPRRQIVVTKPDIGQFAAGPEAMFEGDGRADYYDSTPAPDFEGGDSEDGATPGFAAVAALAALALAFVLFRSRRPT